jgi:hypothetical protein
MSVAFLADQVAPTGLITGMSQQPQSGNTVDEQLRRDVWIDLETGEWGLVSNIRLIRQTELPDALGTGAARRSDFRRSAAEHGVCLPSDVSSPLLHKAAEQIAADRRLIGEFTAMHDSDLPAKD